MQDSVCFRVVLLWYGTEDISNEYLFGCFDVCWQWRFGAWWVQTILASLV